MNTLQRNFCVTLFGCTLVAAHPAIVGAASVAAPVCDYDQLDVSPVKRVYATVPNAYLSNYCVKVRNTHLIRAPLDAIDFVTNCPVKIEITSHPNSTSACSFLPKFEIGDRFVVREWDGETTLTIRRSNTETVNVALHEPSSKLKDVKGVDIDGVPWLWGIDGKLKYFVYLDQRPNGDGINKFYRLEVFDTTDPKWVTCVTHLPEKKQLEQVACGVVVSPPGTAQESDTGGGGEPPLKQR